jgi:adenine-specific DNA methylase/predicted GIY-YIG superfamily endonuclease
MTNDDKRLIEDYLPIEAISAEASREKSVRKGHISTLHLWWARRPLVACRAAVYGALVPASQFIPNGAQTDEKKKSLGRANAAKFVKGLCQYPGSPHFIGEAQHHILNVHADRLTREISDWKVGKTAKPAWIEEFKFSGERVSVEDITAGRAPRPRVLDMFAGGGAIPLEALRLGCDAYALDLNPVAHVIELCTLVYPQKYGKPDPNARGMTGPKNAHGATTWGGLAEEVRHWGEWVLRKVKAEIGDLYPLIPDPEFKSLPAPQPGKLWVYVIKCGDASFYVGQTDDLQRRFEEHEKGKVEWTACHHPLELIHWEEFDKRDKAVKREKDLKTGFGKRWLKREYAAGRLTSRQAGKRPAIQANWLKEHDELPPGYLMPVAYLWTRTVQCKNPACKATVPLVRQTWLCKRPGRYVAMKMVAPKDDKSVQFEIVERRSAGALGFDPEAFSKAGNATCPFCGTVADGDYVKEVGCKGGIRSQFMAIACTRGNETGKSYVSGGNLVSQIDSTATSGRIRQICKQRNLDLPNEPIEINPRSMDVDRWGFKRWSDLFSDRQSLFLLTLCAAVKQAHAEAKIAGVAADSAEAIATYLGILVDRVADKESVLTRWDNSRENCQGTFGRQSLPMVWDFVEPNPFGDASGGVKGALRWIVAATETLATTGTAADVRRGSATELPWTDNHFDAVVTDRPYYDNVSYSNISDFFYVWLKRCIGELHPQHFAASSTPKKKEAIAAF